MKLVLKEPNRLFIQNADDETLAKLKDLLTFKDKSIEGQIKRLKKNPFFAKRYGSAWVNRRIEELKIVLHVSLLFFCQESGDHYTLPGLRKRITEHFPGVEFTNLVNYPEFKLMPWNKKPEHELRYYQEEAVNKLLASGNEHSHIELPTGSGKTSVIFQLIKNTGLDTAVVTPSASIARQVYSEAIELFGKKRVGLYGDGRKDIGKQILICIGKSLAMIKDKPLIDEFKQYQVYISDESHLLGADTFSYFTNSVLGHCPYRWFVSATQMRNDGRDMLLDGNIGPRVYEKSIQELQAQGYLAKLSTLIIDVRSEDEYYSDNAVLMNQHHLYSNSSILEYICRLTKQAISNNMPTLILIDEHSQEALLKYNLGVEYAYACGGSDVEKICNDFNDGKIMCVVGTSAVSTGTNFKPVQLTINWQGNKASTKIKQGAIGRSTRIDKDSGKLEAKIVDFRITNVDMMCRHANERISYYEQVGPVTIMKDSQ